MPTTQAGRAPWRWVTRAPPRVLGPGGQGMLGRQASKVPGLAHTPLALALALAWGRGLTQNSLLFPVSLPAPLRFSG